MAPGKSTRGRGKSGSSIGSFDFGEYVWLVSEKEEEAGQRREPGCSRRRRRLRRRDGDAMKVLTAGFDWGLREFIDEEDGRYKSC